jgi:hypothetical protein
MAENRMLSRSLFELDGRSLAAQKVDCRINSAH